MGFFRVDTLDARHLVGFLRECNRNIFMGMLQREKHCVDYFMAGIISSFRQHSHLRLYTDTIV